jgi:hypothetical protein
MADTKQKTGHRTRDRLGIHRRCVASAAAMALLSVVLDAAPLAAQGIGRAAELGIDAAAVFGLGSQSSIDVNLPGSRFRIGFFSEGSHISIEPAFGLGYNKVEGVDGVFRYDLELGLLYHFAPITMSTATARRITTRVTTPYLRPFVGVTGFSGGAGESDSEVSAGAGLGIKIPWRTDLAWRLEANLGYGFDNKAGRIGALAGLSYFPR